MNNCVKRYIEMKNSYPELTKEIPSEIKNVIYNVLYGYAENNKSLFDRLDKIVWTDFSNEKIDEYERMKSDIGYYFLEIIDTSKNCIKLFSLIDFLLQEIVSLNEKEGNIPNFADELNRRFEKANFGYRIISNQITPITDSNEIKEIEEAVKNVSVNIKEHLNSAIYELSNLSNPNYRKSVNESISAVEAFCYKYTKETVLSDALKKINKKNNLHPQLIKAFENLYYYSSEKKTGIRHGRTVEDSKLVPTYYEAKFMLTACSAFINYIKGKFSEDLENT